MEKELDDKQKEFAVLVARGVPPEYAGQTLEWSKYQIETYSKLPKMQKEIKRWQEVFGVEQTEKYVKLWDEVATEAFLSMLRKIREDKVPEERLMKIINQQIGSITGLPTDPDAPTTERVTERITEKVKREYNPSQLTSVFDHPDYQEQQQQTTKEEASKTHEITQTKTQKENKKTNEPENSQTNNQS